MTQPITLDKEQEQSTLVGKRVRKSIGKQRVFWGNVFALYHISNATFYKVLFDDGDVDIFSTEEVSTLIADAEIYKFQDTNKNQSTSAYTQEIRANLLCKSTSDEEMVDIRHIKLWDTRLYAAIIGANDRVIIRNFSRKPYPSDPEGELEMSGKANPGDIIVAINYKSVKGKGIEEISRLIRVTPRPMILSVMSPHDYDIKYPKETASDDEIVTTTKEIEPEPTPPKPEEKQTNLPASKDIVKHVTITKPQMCSVIVKEQNKVVLKAFADMQNGEKGEIESSQIVNLGDILVAINRTSIRDMRLPDLSSFIRTVKRPFVVTFVSPNNYDRYISEHLRKSHEMAKSMVEPSPQPNNLPVKANPMRQTTLTSMLSQTATPPQKMMIQDPRSFVQANASPQPGRWFICSPPTVPNQAKQQAPGTSQHLTIPQSGSSILSGLVQKQNKPPLPTGQVKQANAAPISSTAAPVAVPVLSSSPGIPQNSFLSPSSVNFINFLAASVPISTPPVPTTTTSTIATPSTAVPKTHNATMVMTQAVRTAPVPTTTATTTTQSTAVPKTHNATMVTTQAVRTAPVPTTTATKTTAQSTAVPKTHNATMVMTQAKAPQPTSTPSKPKAVVASKPNIVQSKMRSLPKQSSMLNHKRHIVRITKQQLMVAIGKMKGRSALASFVHGDNGEKGEIEASGKILCGDFVVQVNETPIARDKTPAQVAQILMKTQRPFEITFERSSEHLLANS